MKKQKNKSTVEDILGLEYHKLQELKGKTFDILSFESENVKGYKEPSIKIKVLIDGDEFIYSTFSTIVRKQLLDLEEKVGFPFENITLSVAKSKDGNEYYRLTLAPKEE